MLQTSERARSPLEQMLLDGTEPKTGGASDVDPLDAYDVVSAVGRGKFSTVYKAYRKSDKTVVALKRIRMGDVGSGASTASKVLQEVRQTFCKIQKKKKKQRKKRNFLLFNFFCF